MAGIRQPWSVTAMSTLHTSKLSTDASRWRGDGGDERGFSMRRLPRDPLDSQCVSRRTMPRASLPLLSFVPWGRQRPFLDLMRRDPSADNGLVELMVASLADRAAVFGVGRVAELRDVPRGV